MSEELRNTLAWLNKTTKDEDLSEEENAIKIAYKEDIPKYLLVQAILELQDLLQEEVITDVHEDTLLRAEYRQKELILR